MTTAQFTTRRSQPAPHRADDNPFPLLIGTQGSATFLALGFCWIFVSPLMRRFDKVVGPLSGRQLAPELGSPFIRSALFVPTDCAE